MNRKETIKGRLGHMMQSHDCRRLVCHKGGSKSLYIFLIMGQEHTVRAHVDLLYKAVFCFLHRFERDYFGVGNSLFIMRLLRSFFSW